MLIQPVLTSTTVNFNRSSNFEPRLADSFSHSTLDGAYHITTHRMSFYNRIVDTCVSKQFTQPIQGNIVKRHCRYRFISHTLQPHMCVCMCVPYENEFQFRPVCFHHSFILLARSYRIAIMIWQLNRYHIAHSQLPSPKPRFHSHTFTDPELILCRGEKIYLFNYFDGILFIVFSVMPFVCGVNKQCAILIALTIVTRSSEKETIITTRDRNNRVFYLDSNVLIVK